MQNILQKNVKSTFACTNHQKSSTFSLVDLGPKVLDLFQDLERTLSSGMTFVWLIILVHSPTQIDQTYLTFLVAHHVTRMHVDMQPPKTKKRFKTSFNALKLTSHSNTRSKTIYIRPWHNHAACILGTTLLPLKRMYASNSRFAVALLG